MRVLAVLGVVALLLYGGLRGEPLPQVLAGGDKLAHVLGFAAFAFTLRIALPRLRGETMAVACVALAVGIELVQALLPLRTPSLADVAAGLLGAGLGALLALAWQRLRPVDP